MIDADALLKEAGVSFNSGERCLSEAAMDAWLAWAATVDDVPTHGDCCAALALWLLGQHDMAKAEAQRCAATSVTRSGVA